MWMLLNISENRRKTALNLIKRTYVGNILYSLDEMHFYYKRRGFLIRRNFKSIKTKFHYNSDSRLRLRKWFDLRHNFLIFNWNLWSGRVEHPFKQIIELCRMLQRGSWVNYYLQKKMSKFFRKIQSDISKKQCYIAKNFFFLKKGHPIDREHRISIVYKRGGERQGFWM